MEQPDYSAEYRHSWALVVGIDDYKDPALPPLRTSVKGAQAVAAALCDDLGFDPERIILLENEEATQRAIRRAFVDPLSREEKVGPDDRVLIYFGGHGLTYDTAEGEIGCIAPYDIEKAYWDTAIAMDELTRLANRMHAKHVLFLLDACFSGFATTREISPGVRRQVGDYLRRPARQVITAGTRDQLAADSWGPDGHALFTGFLLEGLSGAAPTPGGVLRAFHLAGYLQDEVATQSHSLQTPQYAALMGSGGGDFVFSVRDVVELPEWLLAAAASDNSTQRLVAVNELRALTRADDPDVADQAFARLHEMAESDPDALVRSSAQAALSELLPTTIVAPIEREELVVPEPPEPEPLTREVLTPEPPEPPGSENGAAVPPVEDTPHPPTTLRERKKVSAWLWLGGGVGAVGFIVVVALIVTTVLALKGVFGGGAEQSPEAATVEVEEPTVAPTEGRVLFEDDFSDPNSGWYVDDNPDEGSYAYEGGVYAITARVNGLQMWGNAGRSLQDVAIEVDATQVSAPANNNNAYGVGCRVQENGDGYFLRISGDGYYAIYRVTSDEATDDPEFITLIDWTPNNVINQGNATNHIAATCAGTSLSLSVNGQLLGVVEDSMYATGGITMTATTFEDTPTTIHFDNVVVREP